MYNSKGLKFKKLDLHIHTPSSDDFRGEGITPDQIVNTAIKKELTGIAITDHQTAEWVDKVKEEAKGKGLTVFPGVELMVTGGEEGVHIILLFDVDKDTNHVNQFLHTIGIYQKPGKKIIATEKTVGQVADELENFDPTALLILAHAHSTKGVTGDIKGETRSLIFGKQRKCLVGAEANESDFLDKVKKDSHKRVIDCFDGTDPNYHKRKLGVYQASDAHSLDAIGSVFSYFKVDEPITIEDIRQSLLDRETRIRQSFEYVETVYPHIDWLKITSGFLTDQVFEFHEGLNSILGAKGTGKSLAIEFLRFALNQQPRNEDIKIDHEMKLDKCLKLHGEVHVKFTEESGKSYLVIRTYNPAEDNPIIITDLTDGTQKEFQIEYIYPVLFLSQSEVIKIAEDKTGGSQRDFIDHFFDFYRYQQDIEQLNKELSEIDHKFADAIKARLTTLDVSKKIATQKEEIDKLGRQIQNKVFDAYSKKEIIGRAIQTQIGYLESIKEGLNNTNGEYKNLTPPSLGEPDIESDPVVKRAMGLTQKALNDICVNIEKALSFIDEAKKYIQIEYVEWKASFDPIKAEFDRLVKETGGTQVILEQKRKVLVNDVSKLEKEYARHQLKAQQVKDIFGTRTEIINKLDSAYKAYFEERKRRCNLFTQYSGGALNVTIQEREDKTSFKETLLRLKRGSWLRDEDIEIISQKITPNELIEAILRYEWLQRTKKDQLMPLSTKTGIKLDNIEKLAQYLLDEYEYKDLLSLLYSSVPKDVPSISYKVQEEFKKLDELSVGQKAVALLIIALSEGNFPIVIDQPEDSLDLRSIWEDVCRKLRMSKDQRQFIFTTHNSSVAVASDTDMFTILQADANHGRVLHSGSINRGEIKKEVIDYLEGGPDTYEKKRQKYNL